MTTFALDGIRKNLEEDAALTEESPRQPFRENGTPAADVNENELQQTEFMDFIFSGMLEALRRRSI
ncbi:hypothetical protein LCGC14_1420370 [marine sediment metagenome]|uniref:Uncharacterized protein n=1 Tax=marine sediment metagenome TaxID=412755 RepID=A0A0F9KCT4_9ZZZZ